jgi:hypothetical protein
VHGIILIIDLLNMMLRMDPNKLAGGEYIYIYFYHSKGKLRESDEWGNQR